MERPGGWRAETGKTTLANSILKEIAWQFPRERIVLVKDTIELQCEPEDHLSLRVAEGEASPSRSRGSLA